MYVINLQPLSQNQAWSGKRYKSSQYRQYQQDITAYLRTLSLPSIQPKEKYYFYFEFGIPYMQDLSNGIKLLEDIISDYLGINDRDVDSIFCRKIITKKIDAYIKFNIFTDEYSLINSINQEF